MPSKLIIPVVLALLVMAAMPANASSVDTNPVQTQVNNQGQLIISQYNKDTVNVGSYDNIKWYNWWTNQYGGSYIIRWGYNWNGGADTINSANYQDVALSYQQAYSATKEISKTTGELTKFHTYNGVKTGSIKTQCNW